MFIVKHLVLFETLQKLLENIISSKLPTNFTWNPDSFNLDFHKFYVNIDQVLLILLILLKFSKICHLILICSNFNNFFWHFINYFRHFFEILKKFKEVLLPVLINIISDFTYDLHKIYKTFLQSSKLFHWISSKFLKPFFIFFF